MNRSHYAGIVSRFLFPLQERLKRHDTVTVRRALERSQWWDPEHLEAFRLNRLRELLLHAEEHVPYYRELFHKMGVSAHEVNSVHDLRRIPFLDKGLIRANVERLKSERARRLSRSNTGGSSGNPLIFFVGKERVSHDVAAKWRATRWWGVDFGDPEIVVWGSPIELGAQDRIRRFRDKLLRTELLPAFGMSSSELDAFVERIQAARPRMLFGYPSAIAHIARHAEKLGKRMDGLGIAVAFVTSERLYDDQREVIGRVFGCRVANGYGGRDAGFIAHECPSGGMHVTAEDIVIEIVDADSNVLSPGLAGEIVVTHLATKDFPFIRYRTGDFGILDTKLCVCGRGLPLLKDIQGRSTDFVVALDGTVMHGLALIYVIRDLPGIQQFKIVQDSRERTRVLVVPDSGFSDKVVDDIVTGLRARIGQTVDVRVETVGEIPPERSGKFRYIVSHVAT